MNPNSLANLIPFTSETARKAAQKQRLPHPVHPVTIRLYEHQLEHVRGKINMSRYVRELIERDMNTL